MKSTSIAELKKNIQDINPARLTEILLRLARFKKENKELLTYLIFYDNEEWEFINQVKIMIDEMFTEVNTDGVYYAKKTIRKIIRVGNKFIRISGKPETACEILLHIASGIQELNLDIRKSQVLINMYNALLKKSDTMMKSLHEDLQYDIMKQRKDFDFLT